MFFFLNQQIEVVFAEQKKSLKNLLNWKTLFFIMGLLLQSLYCYSQVRKKDQFVHF